MGEPCAKCGSRKVVPDAELLDQGQYSDGALKAKYERHPSAIFFKGREVTALRARICARCGFVELYAERPEDLYEAYRDVLDQEAEE
jgi:hypothetical protein